MPFTTNKSLSVQTAGTHPGVWGEGNAEALNEGVIQPIDLMLGGVVTKTLSNVPVTLSATEIQSCDFRLIGAMSGNVTVTSAAIGFCFVENLTSGSYTVTWTNGVASVTLTQGRRYVLFADASNGVRIMGSADLSGQATALVSAPQGYLTPTSGTPIITGDVVAATTVYYTPYVGAQVPIYSSGAFVSTAFAELALVLNSNHVASTIYDVFVFANSGVVTVATGPAWSNSGSGTGARGTGAGTTQLSRVSGLLVNTVAITGRNGATTYSIDAGAATYVGSLFIDGTAGQVSCYRSWGQSRKWGIWNYYNRQNVTLKAGDSATSWIYNTNTTRPSNGSAANSLIVFCGMAEERIITTFDQVITVASSAGSSSISASCGIGWNSTTAFVSAAGSAFTTAAPYSSSLSQKPHTEYDAAPILGIITVTSLELTGTASSGDATYGGTELFMNLKSDWRA